MNVTPDCDQLDAFLLGELSPQDAEHFELHVCACEECREAVEQQQWIDNLLRSNAATQAEQAPLSLRDSLRNVPVRRRKRVVLTAFAVATAASLLIAVGWIAIQSQSVDTLHDQVVKPAIDHPISPTDMTPALATDATRPRATFVSDGDSIAVPVESTDDDVTIVQLYRTTETERRLQRELALQVTLLDSNGG
jgi:anti-sigma factor RsiW